MKYRFSTAKFDWAFFPEITIFFKFSFFDLKPSQKKPHQRELKVLPQRCALAVTVMVKLMQTEKP